MNSFISIDFFTNHLFRKRVPIDSLGIHGIITVRYRNNTGMDRNLFTCQPLRITTAIISLMMISCHFFHVIDQRNIFENIRANCRVCFDNIVFRIQQLGRLVKNDIRNTYFTDIMQIRSVLEICSFPITPSKFFRDQCSILRNAKGMSFGIFIFFLNGRGQCLNHLQRHGFRLSSSNLHLLLMTPFLHIPYILHRLDNGEEQQKDKTGSKKNSGYTDHQISRHHFYKYTGHSYRNSDYTQQIVLDLPFSVIQNERCQNYKHCRA